MKDAIHAYTMALAYASFEEKSKGLIEPGKLADFVVLSEDILAIDPVKIAGTKVWATIFNGALVVTPKSLADELQSR